MSRRDTDEEPEGIVNELDGVLPGEIDRRKFFKSSAGALGAMMFAGCLGDGGDGGNGTAPGIDGNGSDTGNQSEFSDDTQITFANPWTPEPTWGTIHTADGGYFENAGVPNIDAVRGQGSDAEIQQVGAGNKEMAISSLTTAIGFLPGGDGTDPLDVSIMGLSKGRPLLSLIYRTDEMDGPADVSGKSVYQASGFAAASWPVFPPLAGVDASTVSTSSGTEASGPVLLAENDVQAIWGSIDLIAEYQAEADVELGIYPLTGYGPFYGFPIWVNDAWFEGKENNVEFVAHVLEGYYRALKWVLTNQEEYLSYMENEVNPNLQTWSDEEMNGQYQAFAAQAVNPEMKDQGLGYFTQEGVQFALENAGPPLVDNPDQLPSANELTDKRAWEASTKVTFSDSEWDTVVENAGPLWDLFAEASNN